MTDASAPPAKAMSHWRGRHLGFGVLEGFRVEVFFDFKVGVG